MYPDSQDYGNPSVAHDLKSPLTGIQMTLHLLAEQKIGPLNERQAKMVAQATGDCERLLDAINRVVTGAGDV